jgi:hypothetical protein
VTTAAAKKIRAKRARRPIYFVVRKVADVETGEVIKALVAAHPIDARLMKERGFRLNHEYRADLKQARAVWMHRLMHKIGGLMVDNVEGWESLKSHDAVKRLQRESGVCCEEIEIEIPGLGKLVAKQAESLAFDEMEQDRFEQLFEGITKHIGDTYAHVMLDDVREEFWSMANREPQR